MATPAQILANAQNAQKSAGAQTAAGKQASSQNRTTHGLAADPNLHSNSTMYFLEDESIEKWNALFHRLFAEHKPQTETEVILVRRMAQHDWLRARALRLQNSCMPDEDYHMMATQHFALYLRYQTTHERAFYKALTELQKLRNERAKEQIGFESQKRAQAGQAAHPKCALHAAPKCVIIQSSE